jgi:hypothetical protein
MLSHEKLKVYGKGLAVVQLGLAFRRLGQTPCRGGSTLSCVREHRAEPHALVQRPACRSGTGQQALSTSGQSRHESASELGRKAMGGLGKEIASGFCKQRRLPR